MKGPIKVKHLLQDEDHSGNGPRNVPTFPCQCPGEFPERFRIAPELVSSKRTPQIFTVQLVSLSMFC